MIDYINYSKYVVNILFLIMVIYFISNLKKVNSEYEYTKKVRSIFILTFVILPYNLVFETFVPYMCFIFSFFIKFNGPYKQPKTAILESNIKKYLITYAIVTLNSTMSDRTMCMCCEPIVVYTLCAIKAVIILVISIILITYMKLFMKDKKIPTLLCVIIVCLTVVLSLIFDFNYTDKIHSIRLYDASSYNFIVEAVINFLNK